MADLGGTMPLLSGAGNSRRVDCLTLNIEAIYFSETSEIIYHKA